MRSNCSPLRKTSRRTCDAALVVLGLARFASLSAAQGPLTGSLPEVPPPAVFARLGPIQLTPDLTIKQLGVDENVFNDAVNPRHDYVIGLTPELIVFSRAGLMQFAASTSADYTYYTKYTSERSVGHTARGRLDLNLGRLRPSIAGAANSTRERANNEIDARARRRDTEISTRLAFQVTPLADIFVGAARLRVAFREGDAFRGIALDQSLNRQFDQVQFGVRLNPTPFTSVVIDGTVGHDRFTSAHDRDSRSRTASTEVIFGNEAIVRGRVRLGFQDFTPDDPTLKPYRGVVSGVTLNYRGFWRGRIDGTIERQIQYSYDEAAGYFANTGAQAIYTQHVRGPFDVQGVYGRSLMDYGKRLAALPRSSHTRLYGVGLGYNRQNGSRIGISYEYRNREATDARESYRRQRLFATYSYIY